MTQDIDIPGTQAQRMNGQVIDAETGEIIPAGELERAQLEHQVLQRLDGFRQELEYARSQGDIKAIKLIADGQQAVKYVTQKARLGTEVQNEAAENKIHTQISGGELLLEMPTHPGTRGQLVGRDVSGAVATTAPETDVSKLGEDGMPSQYESKTWKRLASANRDTIQAKIDEIRAAGYELSTAAILKYIGHHGALGTGENEWYTPPDVLEDVRLVLGTIELDPASSEAAQQVVKAEHFFTKEDDALTQDWFGKVFLNPPYSQPDIDYFASKMAAEVKAERVAEAIMLTHNYTDTRWFHAAETEAKLICFTRGRIAFVSKSGALAAPTQGQAFFYYGENADRFRDVFIKRGFIR